MSRAGMRAAHAVAGGVALLTMLTFWISTVLVELAGTPDSVVTVKRTIPWGLVLLVPALAATGITGMRLTRNARGRLVRRKVLRMRLVAVIGLLVLAPCMLYLGVTASVDEPPATLYTVQAVELAAGATNIILLMLNAWDGLRLTGRLRTGAVIRPSSASATQRRAAS